ncbi:MULTISPECIES: Rha family transcriptional regulator [Pseudomonas]|uniref:Rha family transcriptional regulator n=1 Tax=Pseudomonas TaxID=286 RepID=UPI001F2B2D58|nr:MULTISPECIES: Rha family transcriptional regulator [Pseudomonas]MDU9416183.1 Rha family transcriptional regulator [Pseudomonas sp. zfem005]
MNLMSSTALTMSSQQIADLVGSRHDKVKQSIERLAERAAIQLPPLGVVRNHLGQAVSVYLVCKRDSFVVVAQLSPEFTAALVDRWQELERQAGQGLLPDFSSPADAARAWAEQYEQRQALQLENQQQAEAIASLESLFLSGETPTQFCKRLNGVNCSRVNSTLLDIGWLYDENRGENGSPRYRVASRVRDKYLTERPRKISPEGGDAFIKYDLQLLLAGAQRLHQLYMQQKLAMKSTWDGRFTQAKHTGETI